MSVTVYSPTAPPDSVVEKQIRLEVMRRNPAMFATYYMRPSDDPDTLNQGAEKFQLKDFHVEMLDLCISDLEKILFLEPAAYGKTTMVAKIFPIYLVCFYPNVRIKLGSKNSDDAEARLFAIRQELENNELLLEDFGEFRSDKWKEKEINVAQRTVRDIEPTIRAFGSESSIIGTRATHLILDDIVTEQNSGTGVEDETRRKLSVMFNTSFKRVGYPRRRLLIRWVQTVVHQQDLAHEVAALHGQMPDDDRERWTSDKGWTVVLRRSLNETTGEPLWPEVQSREDLELERDEDLFSWLKRKQNRCIDPAMLNFQRVWFEGNANSIPPLIGCLDHSRRLQENPPMREGMRYLRVAGYDPSSGLSDEAKHCGYIELGFDGNLPDAKRVYYVTDMARFRMTLPDQETFLVDRALARQAALTLIERNAAQQWILQLQKIKDAISIGHRIEGHHTNPKNKPDPETGISSMAPLIREGRLRFPYGEVRAKQLTETVIGEFTTYPQGASSDMLMAIWFAILAAKKVAVRKGLRTYGGSVPGWANRGASLATIERFYPTMRSPSEIANAPVAVAPDYGDIRRGRLDAN